MRKVIKYKTQGWGYDTILKCMKEAKISHFKIVAYKENGGGYYLHIYKKDLSKLDEPWQTPRNWEKSYTNISGFNPVVYKPPKRAIKI